MLHGGVPPTKVAIQGPQASGHRQQQATQYTQHRGPQKHHEEGHERHETGAPPPHEVVPPRFVHEVRSLQSDVEDSRGHRTQSRHAEHDDSNTERPTQDTSDDWVRLALDRSESCEELACIGVAIIRVERNRTLDDLHEADRQIRSHLAEPAMLTTRVRRA